MTQNLKTTPSVELVKLVQRIAATPGVSDRGGIYRLLYLEAIEAELQERGATVFIGGLVVFRPKR